MVRRPGFSLGHNPIDVLKVGRIRMWSRSAALIVDLRQPDTGHLCHGALPGYYPP